MFAIGSSSMVSFKRSCCCWEGGQLLAALDHIDEKLLIDRPGLSRATIDELRAAWIRLRDGRLSRGKKTRANPPGTLSRNAGLGGGDAASAIDAPALSSHRLAWFP